MALIIDPDDLSQGLETAVSDAVFGSPTGATVTITSAGSNLPSIDADDYFEIRDHSDPVNNGLYKESGGSPSTSSITADKITGPNPAAGSSEAIRTFGANGAATEYKSVHFDTDTRKWYLLQQGNLSTDGVKGQAFYSFTKEEWKNDSDLIAHDFPFIAITPEQFESVEDWAPATPAGESVITEKLMRTAGWSEIDSNNILLRQWAGSITLGTFEDDANDVAFYQFGTDQSVDDTVDFDFAGPVNEAVLTYEELGNPTGCDFATSSTITRSSGSFITDGYKVGGSVTIRNADQSGNNDTFLITAVAAMTLTVSGTPFTTGADSNAQLSVDNRSSFSIRLRIRDGDPNGKSYDSSDLTAIGLTSFTNKAERFPLSNSTDLKISETDANIDSNTPYTEIRIRYLPSTYNREVDSATKRDFGIIVDVGTYSQANGVSAGTTLFTSASLNLGAGEALADYTNGSLIIHEGTDQGTHTISGTPVDNSGTLEITLSSALSGSESNLSFTMERATPLTATAEEIYEKVQRQLRKTTDIDETSGTVIGRAADELLTFVGDTLNTGVDAPINPNGGGSGVFIEGFDSNDTNRLGFTDNGGTLRNFPFVAAGTINFNPNLVNDTMGMYWMFFEYSVRTNVSDLAISGASGSTASIDSAGANLPVPAQNDYVLITGATNPENNGIWVVTDASPTSSQWDARKIDGATVVNESAFSGVVDENPIDSPGSIIVNDNGGSPIQGSIGASSASFDFDYDNNVQGGRTASTDADIILRAIGFETAQYVEASGTITRNVGLSFSLVAGLERNYSNP